MKSVRSCLRGHINRSSRGAAILRTFVVRHDVKLRNGVRRNSDDLIIKALITLAIGVVIHAIQQEIIKHTALAINVIRAGAYQMS